MSYYQQQQPQQQPQQPLDKEQPSMPIFTPNNQPNKCLLTLPKSLQGLGNNFDYSNSFLSTMINLLDKISN